MWEVMAVIVCFGAGSDCGEFQNQLGPYDTISECLDRAKVMHEYVMEKWQPHWILVSGPPACREAQKSKAPTS